MDKDKIVDLLKDKRFIVTAIIAVVLISIATLFFSRRNMYACNAQATNFEDVCKKSFFGKYKSEEDCEANCIPI